MIRNIFLLGLRNFFKNRIYTVTILLSLATGFAIANILIGFTLRELNTDSYHTNKDRIYRLVSEDPFGRDGMISFLEAFIPGYVVDTYPEIEAATLMNTLRYNGISKEGSAEKFYDLILLMTDTSFLKIFDLNISEGNPQYAIGPGHIILTRELSEVLFDKYPSITRDVNITTDTVITPLRISGIIEEPLENSHLVFDGLVYFDDFKKIRGGVCYVLLRKDVNADDFEKKINSDPAMPSLLGPGKINYHLQPLEEVYYDEDNSRSFSRARGKFFLWISGAITFTVLFLAGFNFLNLFFNAFLKRWKEFGMKKVFGATVLVFRLTAILEVAIYIAVSFIISLLLTAALLPWFNRLLASNLSITYYLDIRIILLTGFLILIIAILVILKLTNYMYKINPVSLLRNKSQFKLAFNRNMLGIQFFISIILLICSLTIIRQTNYIKNKPLGFNRNMLEVRAPGGADMNKMHVLKNLMNTIPGISSSTLCSGNPISDNMIARYDLENGEFYTPYIFIGDEDYLNTIGLSLITGEIPSPGNPSGKLINEAFVRYFNMKDPVGEKIPGTKEDFISGIVKDFNIASFQQEIPPTIISIDQISTTLIAKVDLSQSGNIIPLVEKYWQEVYPAYPFKYLLMGDELTKKHKDDLVFSKIIISSALLSILLTCFGLFALSWGTMQERSKEIGIRKVVGASSINILQLLITNYLKIILFAFITGIPLAIYLMNRWLERFVFKIEVGSLPLVFAGVLLIIITFLTIGYHTVKSSIQNPVNILRYE